MGNGRKIAIWSFLGIFILVPILAAAASPLLAWREPIYILAGFAGVIGLSLLLLQPLLIAQKLPGLSVTRSRKLHGLTGALLTLAVAIHVAGLYLTSPPDVVDVLMFRSPTPFSVWGVLAMWAVVLAAFLAMVRKRIALKPSTWRKAHGSLVLVIVVGTIVHALLIQGTMETITKIGLCTAVFIATLWAFTSLRLWKALTKWR